MPQGREPEEERPPFLKSWRRVYVATLFYLGAVILASYLFTRAFR